MNSVYSRNDLCEVQQAFNRKYPFLRVEWVRPGGEILRLISAHGSKDERYSSADQLLDTEWGVRDDMKVSELESVLSRELGIRVQMFRKSGNYWMETRMTRDWTLKQQNDHGREISS